MSGLPSYSPIAPQNNSELLKLSRKIETGFPSPAGDHLEKALSLEELIVQRPTSTFYVRADGNAMKAAGIYHQDILVVDRSLTPQNGSIIIASYEEEIIIRRLVIKGANTFLTTGDIKHPPIFISQDTNWMIWGIVTHLIHRFRPVDEAESKQEPVYEVD
ncbi:MAG: LexA family transcriptional regulator [Balneola sp.]|nr:MAG: LexA family transcriptional regulator [Balneola sp.]